MSSYRMQEKKNRFRFASHSQYIFLQPLPGLQIVGSSQKKKNKINRKCAIWERPRAFFASRFTARMHVTIFKSF